MNNNFQFLIFNFQSIFKFKFLNFISNCKLKISNSPAKWGFTLIELLVVISIIGILIALSAVAFQSSRASARDAKRKTDLETIRSALEMYKTDCVSYPSSPLANPLIGSGLPSACATANVYLSTVPQDPRPSLSYSYNPSPAASPTSYVLCAHLENGGTTAASGCPTGATECGEVCNYGVFSP